jgi:hypothetical protein
MAEYRGPGLQQRLQQRLPAGELRSPATGSLNANQAKRIDKAIFRRMANWEVF